MSAEQQSLTRPVNILICGCEQDAKTLWTQFKGDWYWGWVQNIVFAAHPLTAAHYLSTLDFQVVIVYSACDAVNPPRKINASKLGINQKASFDRYSFLAYVLKQMEDSQNNMVVVTVEAYTDEAIKIITKFKNSGRHLYHIDAAYADKFSLTSIVKQLEVQNECRV